MTKKRFGDYTSFFLTLLVCSTLGTNLVIPVVQRKNDFIASAEIDPWIIDGDTVYIDDTNVYASATPHTLNGDDEVVFEFMSKTYSGDIDIAWGFDTTVMKPTGISLWQNYVHNVSYLSKEQKWGCTTLYNVTAINPLDISDYDLYDVFLGNENNTFLYEVTHNCDDSGDVKQIYAFSDRSPSGPYTPGVNYTICGYYTTTVIRSCDETYFDWKDWDIDYTHVDWEHEGMTDWYVISDIPVVSGITYNCSINMTILDYNNGTIDGKYWFAFKPSSETLSEAYSNGHLYALDPWYDAGWSHRINISLNSSQVEKTMKEFPVLINITNSSLSYFAQSDGGDILFTDSSGSKLYHEIEDYDSSNGELVAWVNIDTLTSSVDTNISMYYGNPTCGNQWSVANTWNSGYYLVQHLQETSGTHYDSTSNDADSTSLYLTAQGSDYVIANGGDDFERTDVNYILFSDPGDFNTYTIELLIKPESLNNYETILGKYQKFHLDTQADARLAFSVEGTGGATLTNALTAGSWHYCSASVDGATCRLKCNDDYLPNSCTGNLDIDFAIGFRSGYWRVDAYDGLVDEVRISDVCRNTSWINTTYNSIMNATDGGFFLLDAQEELDADKPQISYVFPTPQNLNFSNVWDYVNINTSITDTTNTSSFIDFNTSLLGYWNFEYTNSTHVFDNSTHDHHARFKGGIDETDISAGIRGDCMDFDGTSEWLRAPNDIAKNMTESFTWSVWIKTATTSQDTIIGVNPANGANRYMLFVTATGVLSLYSGDAHHYTTVTVNDDIWHHIVVTRDHETGYNRFYIDSVRDDTGNYTTTSHIESTDNVSIGQEFDGAAASDFFDGLIDEVAMFNRTLSYDEIKSLYNSSDYSLSNNFTSLNEGTHTYQTYSIDRSGNFNITLLREFYIDLFYPHISFNEPRDEKYIFKDKDYALIDVDVTDTHNTSTFFDWCNSLTGYYSFDNHNAHYVNDNSSYDRNASFINGNLQDGNFTIAKYGEGLQFDGVDDTLNISTRQVISSEGTVEFWVKFDDVTKDQMVLIGGARGAQAKGTYDCGFIRLKGSDSKLYAGFYSSGDFDNTSSDSALVADTWYHISLIWSDRTRLRIDTVLQSANDVFTNVFTYWIDDFVIGRTMAGAVNDMYFDGKLDELRFYNRSLSRDELNASYNEALYPFVENYTGLSEDTYSMRIFSIDQYSNLNITPLKELLFDWTYPHISFVTPPTPNNNSYVDANRDYINVTTSISDVHDTSSFIDWNNSLVGYWSFDFVESIIAYDNSSYLNNGRLITMTTDNITVGIRGNCSDYCASLGSSIRVVNDDSLYSTPNNQWTIAAWIYPDVFSGNMVIARKKSDGGAYFIRLTSDGEFQSLLHFNTDSYTQISAGDINLSEWNHVAMTYDGSYRRHYINGQLVKKHTDAKTLEFSSDGDFYIGCNDGVSEYFDGKIDEVMVFNRCLSYGEINSTYNSSSYALYHNFTSLSGNHYPYRIYSIDEAGLLNITPVMNSYINRLPQFSNEFPLNSTYYYDMRPTVNVTIVDADNQTLNVTVLINASGSWTNVDNIYDYNYTVRQLDAAYRWMLDGDTVECIDSFPKTSGNNPDNITGIIPCGVFPLAKTFDGTEKIGLGSKAGVNTDTTLNRSFSGWFSTREIDTNSNGRIIWEEGGSSNSIVLYVHEESGENRLYLVCTEGTSIDYVYYPIEENRTYHVAATICHPDQEMKLYINGSLVASDTDGFATGEIMAAHSDGCCIGGPNGSPDGWDGSSVSGYFNGVISDFIYWPNTSSILTSSQISDIYMSGSGNYSYLYDSADEANTKYYWSVYVNDGVNNISQVYHFNTGNRSFKKTTSSGYFTFGNFSSFKKTSSTGYFTFGNFSNYKKTSSTGYFTFGNLSYNKKTSSTGYFIFGNFSYFQRTSTVGYFTFGNFSSFQKTTPTGYFTFANFSYFKKTSQCGYFTFNTSNRGDVSIDVDYEGIVAVLTPHWDYSITQYMWNVSENDGIYNGTTGWVNNTQIDEYRYAFGDADSVTITLYARNVNFTNSSTAIVQSYFDPSVEFEDYDIEKTIDEHGVGPKTEKNPWFPWSVYSIETGSIVFTFLAIVFFISVYLIFVRNKENKKIFKYGDYIIEYIKENKKKK